MASNSVGYSGAAKASASATGPDSKALLEMVQLLVAQGVTEVPKKFIQPEQLRVQQAPTSRLSSDKLMIPVIDMAGLDGDNKDHVMAEIARACEKWGFFQVPCLLLVLFLLR